MKNLPYTAKEAEVKELFERYGELKRFMVSPFNTLAIAEFTSKASCKSALKNLAYHKVNFVNPIYLEYAPKGLVRKKALKKEGEEDEDEDMEVKEVKADGEAVEDVVDR